MTDWSPHARYSREEDARINLTFFQADQSREWRVSESPSERWDGYPYVIESRAALRDVPCFGERAA